MNDEIGVMNDKWGVMGNRMTAFFILQQRYPKSYFIRNKHLKIQI
jgi:hypothetical protein